LVQLESASNQGDVVFLTCLKPSTRRGAGSSRFIERFKIKVNFQTGIRILIDEKSWEIVALGKMKPTPEEKKQILLEFYGRFIPTYQNYNF
jgi:hypothetical protein